LSFAQQRLWFLDQLNPGSAEYIVPSPILLSRKLDVTALRAALDTLVERHEVLRTRLVADTDGVPWQVIDPASPFDLPIIDLTAEADPFQAARAWVALDTAKPFVLDTEPMIRGSLLRLSEDEHILALCMHHIVFDEWSAKIFHRELEALYTSYQAGQPNPLTPLPVQYADFAVWQRDWLTGPVLDEQLDYWRTQLADAPILDLPTDRPRPAVRSTAGAAISFHLGTEITRRLQEISRRHGATMFMTLLAAYATLLGKYTGQEDLIVGTPVANRNHGETEQLIGFFVNTLALRADLRDDPTFTQLLAQIRATALAAYTHQDVPFEQLIDELAVARDRSRTPLVQTLFNYTTTASDSSPTSSVESLPARFDVALTVGHASDEGLIGSIQYSTALFDEATVRRMVGHLTELLTAITADPDQHLSALPILTPNEHQQLTVDWNAATAELPQANGIHELITGCALARPHAPAVVYDDIALTYGQLETRANQLAHHLLGLGLQREGVVGLRLPRSTHMIVAILAIWKAGGTYLPLDPDYPTDRLTYMLTDSGADLLITTEHTTELPSRIPAIGLDDPATNAALDTQPTTPPDVTGLSHILALDDPATNAALDAQPTTPPEVTVLPDQAAYLIYTSGSTGRPKAVQATHRSAINLATTMRPLFAIDHTSNVLQFASFSFDAAILDITVTLTTGATLVLATPEQRTHPDQLTQLINRHHITTASIVPSLLATLTPDATTPPSTSLKTLILGAERLSSQLADAWAPHLTLHNTYGPTETTVITTTTPPLAPSGSMPAIGSPL
ncbi:non-ribosomal peptide synthetase, partial [Nonomuraea guangzhouensis]